MRTLCLKDRRGELKIQRSHRRSTPKARRKKTCRARPWPPICSALKHRHPLSGPSRRLSRSIKARIRRLASDCAVRADARCSVATLLRDEQQASDECRSADRQQSSGISEVARKLMDCRPKRPPEVQISLFPGPRQRLFPQGNGLLRLTRDLCFWGTNFQIGGTRNQGAGRTLSRCNRLGRHGGIFAT